ncbi:bifunctional pantoate--beta-alanine ligase/(d)CMP kinase [Oscillatoria sp. FACHB-1407]|uniref:bifunctional pantoate--beta-alanine ligase/(d)CMP kinase n=1 Tax=Oscillatoria sp. FACHB-1407 TaxID=2692847 RepID=UPI0016832AF4|nr:bifunctional pantoate--beta-alanine ligase/(d)CMP kinase [Oscillatoria sp. FACHB-1407]MBD2462447.1 bifunctional pantoate--beta-alanine ligase/(d)CMP kinase [Oscillatoria sp. FACHB-1407]
MRLFRTVAGLRCYLNLVKPGWQAKDENRGGAMQSRSSGEGITFPSVPVTVGLVPTMGALHEGHLSLIRRARRETDVVVVSIFVNPLQFGPNEDFQKYPRTLESDQVICEQAGVDVIFAPSAEELYGTVDFAPANSVNKQTLTQVIPPVDMMSRLCGHFRPGHFEGVATVVTKLFHLVQPNRAYFGQKDAQQLAILQRVVKDLNLSVEIIPCPIVREPDGLALSSRNRYLSEQQRSQATVLSRALQQAEELFCRGNAHSDDLLAAVKAELATTPDVRVEYVELVHPETMMPLATVEEVGLLAIAAYVGNTRLIDNIILRNRQPIIAIDGPAGAGKSTVVRQVAQKLGLLYLDTGAMYRAVTWLVLQSGVAIDDEPAIAELVSQCDIVLENPEEDSSAEPIHMHTSLLKPRVWINGQDVTQVIRSPEVTAQVSAIAAQAAVRQALVKRQQEYGRKGGVVMDGRDIGTHVFPDAELKIFLTASVQERARRRQLDLKNQGQLEIDLEELERSIFERDRKDSTRAISPLQKAADAIEIVTDGMTIAEVTHKIIDLYRQRLAVNPTSQTRDH